MPAVAKRIGAGAVGGLSGLCVRCYVIDGTALGIDETSFTSNEDDAQDQSQATGQAA